MRKRDDAIVVGHGAGRAVVACRPAQTGLRAAVPARRRRYPLGRSPRNWADASEGWMRQHEQVLLGVRPVNEATVVQRVAYGGGSHSCANMHIRIPPDLFDSGWPDGYRRTTLDPYCDLFASRRDVRPIGPDRPLGLPAKATQMPGVARRLGRTDQLFFPNLVINFGDRATSAANTFGGKRFGCRHCGECDFGCHVRVKNRAVPPRLAVVGLPAGPVPRPHSRSLRRFR